MSIFFNNSMGLAESNQYHACSTKSRFIIIDPGDQADVSDLLAHTHRVQFGQLLGVPLHELRELEHVHCPFVRGQGAPMRECGLSGLDGQVDIFLGCFMHGADLLVGGRVGDVECLAGFGFDKLSIPSDKHIRRGGIGHVLYLVVDE
jgi:hypothetical protein